MIVCQKVLTVFSQNNKEFEQKYVTNRSVFVTKTLQLSLYWEGDAHIWFSFGRYDQQYIAGTVKCSDQFHVFASSPPDRRPN